MGFWHVQVEMILQALEYETGEFVFKISHFLCRNGYKMDHACINHKSSKQAIIGLKGLEQAIFNILSAAQAQET